MTVKATLEERGKRYGDFYSLAELSQSMKAEVRAAMRLGERDMEPDQIEAIEMILHKIARIVNGDPHYVDSWDDIAGYATLVANRLRDEQK